MYYTIDTIKNISDIIFKTIKNMNAGTVIEKTEEMKEREAKAKILLEKGKDLTAQEQLDLLPIGTKASVKKRKKIILDDAEKRVKKELDKLLANSVQLCLDYKLSAHIEGSHSIRYAVLQRI